MEEDESKIRRNLVWLSSLIFAWWFIGIDLSEVTKKLLGTDKIDHPDRIWIVVVVLMYYVVARFWNSEKAVNSRSALRDLRAGFIQAWIMNVLRKDVELLKVQGGCCAKYIDNEFVKNRLNQISFGPSHGLYIGGAPDPVKLLWQGFDRSKLRKSAGVVEISFSVVGEDKSIEGAPQVSSISAPYQFPRWKHRWFLTKIYLKLFLWDSETTYFVFPILLWIVAVVITFCNVWSAFKIWTGG